MIIFAKILTLIAFTTLVRGNEKPSVIIVGAGVSGIAAATKLFENGFTDFKVLEAEDYIGGRVKTVHFEDGYVNLGAGHVYGEKGNVIWDLVKDLDLLKKVPMDMTFWLSNGDVLDEETGNQLWELFKNIYYNEDNKFQVPETTVKDYFESKYKEEVEKVFKDKPEKKKLAMDALILFTAFINGEEGTFQAEDASAKNSFEINEGHPMWSWSGKGMKALIDVLLKKIPDSSKALPIDDKILLGKEVSKITWKGVPKPTVELKDGSSMSADCIIFTPSVGVLKESKKMFVPELPDEKIKAINTMGMGSVMKLIMHFPEKFWTDANKNGFVMMWSKEDGENLMKDFSKGNMMGTNWLLDVCGMWPVAGNSNVMEVWIAGKSVPELEKTSDSDIMEGMTFMMKKFLSKQLKPTKPDKMIKTTWFANPHFKGSWPFETLESRKLPSPVQDVLASPLTGDNSKPALLFAGDATHLKYYSTANGAIETGWREAQRIMDM